MKKILLLSLSVLFMSSMALMAQKPFVGTVTYSSKITGTDDPNITSQAPGNVEKKISGNMSKTVLTQEGLAVTTIFDGDAMALTIVLDITGMGKYYMKTDKAKIEEQYKTKDFKYEYLEEYKTIAEHKAQKVNVTITDLETDEQNSLVCYVSKELNNSAAINAMEMPGLVGFILSTETPAPELGEGVHLIMEATAVAPSKKIKSVEFLLPSDAKDLKENPELMKMLGLDAE